MSEQQPTRLSTFAAELKRRHVFRSLLAYGAVAFVVLQAAEIVVPAFGIGDWLLQVLVLGSILLLPVVLALAWVYEITPHGIRSMRELDEAEGRRLEESAKLVPRLALLLVAASAAGVGFWWVGTEIPTAGATDADPASGVASPGIRSAATDPDAPIRSLAVLPLESFSPPRDDAGEATDDRYFAMGMHDAIISRLSQLGSFRVVSRTTVQQYDATGRNIAEIGAELGVEGIVEGSVVVDGNRVRITVQLIHAPSDTHLWSADYERELDDILGLQNEVATAIAREILGELTPESQTETLAASNPAPEADPEAAMAELKGRAALFDGAALDPDVAERHFRMALEEDSSYAPAMVGLASSRLVKELMSGGEPSGEVLASVRTFAGRALELDPASQEARDILVLAEGLEAEFGAPPAPPERPGVRAEAGAGDDPRRRIVRRSPVPAVWTDLGARLQGLSVALAADSLAAPAMVQGARSLVAVGRHDQAVRILHDVVENHPSHQVAWDELEHVLVVQGHLGEVVEVRRRRRETGPASATVPGAPSLDELEQAVERQGAQGYWRWRLQELEARARAGQEVSPVEVATCYAALGRADDAFQHLARAAEAGDPELVTLRGDPTWDPYRRDPRFHEVLKTASGSRRDRS